MVYYSLIKQVILLQKYLLKNIFCYLIFYDTLKQLAKNMEDILYKECQKHILIIFIVILNMLEQFYIILKIKIMMILE